MKKVKAKAPDKNETKKKVKNNRVMMHQMADDYAKLTNEIIMNNPDFFI